MKIWRPLALRLRAENQLAWTGHGHTCVPSRPLEEAPPPPESWKSSSLDGTRAYLRRRPLFGPKIGVKKMTRRPSVLESANLVLDESCPPSVPGRPLEEAPPSPLRAENQLA